MGVKCSLLGHDYGDTDVERERTEEGDEVVRTAKRVERCRSCNHKRTVSENTEVTTLEAAAGVVREPDGTILAASAADETPSDSFGSSIESGDSSIWRNESSGVIVEKPDKTESASVSSDTDANPTNENGVGSIDEIRDDRPEIRNNGPNRAPGEWPKEPNEPAHPKAARDESAGLDSSGSLTVARAGTAWPDETDTRAETQTGPSERRNATNGPETDTSTHTDRPGTMFACPSCEFNASITDSPLRAGDICPVCQHGYLARGTRKG